MELAAAKAAAILKARAAHLAIAAAHIEASRIGRPRTVSPRTSSLPLQIAFAVNDDGSEFDEVLHEIDLVTAG